MPDLQPNDPRRRGSNVLMLLVLAGLIAGLVFWAWQRNPPTTPSPSATAMPEAVPGGSNQN